MRKCGRTLPRATLQGQEPLWVLFGQRTLETHLVILLPFRAISNRRGHGDRRNSYPKPHKNVPLATKTAIRPDLGEVARREGSFCLGKQRLDSFVGHEVNLLVGCACLQGGCDQLLISPGSPVEDRLFQCTQGLIQRGGPINLHDLHPRFRRAMAAPKSLLRRTNCSRIVRPPLYSMTGEA